MRIISGEKRGKKLLALEGDKVRPTSGRVKESLFNILQFQLEGRRFLDLFAGSGQIAIEALSRGASGAVLVDSSKESAAVIEKNLVSAGYKDKAKLVTADVLGYLASTQERFDLAFLDPPYGLGLLQHALPMVAQHVQKGGAIICEHPGSDVLPEVAGDFVKVKSYRYGKIFLSAYRHRETLDERTEQP